MVKHWKRLLAIITKVSEHLRIVKTSIDAMLEERKVTNKIEDLREKAIAYDENVKVILTPFVTILIN